MREGERKGTNINPETKIETKIKAEIGTETETEKTERASGPCFWFREESHCIFDDDCLYDHLWRNDALISLRTLSS